MSVCPYFSEHNSLMDEPLLMTLNLTVLVISVISTFHHTTIAQSFFIIIYLYFVCVCLQGRN